MDNRRWISIRDTDAVAEGAAAIKQVARSGHIDAGNSSSTTVCYDIQGFWQCDSFSGKNGESFVDLPEGGHILTPGAPMLVSEGLFVAIPQNASFTGISILTCTERKLDGETDIQPVPKPVLETETPEYIRDESIYENGEVYPTVTVEYVDTREVYGVKCVHVMVYPMKYLPKDRRISIVEHLEFAVQYTLDDRTDTQTDCRVSSRPGLSAMVLGYNPGTDSATDSLPRMLIVTTADFKPALEQYILHKSKAFHTDVAILDDIYRQYPSCNHVDAIQSYILAQHSKSSLRYVLLAGDLSTIPALTVTDPGVGTFVSDSYYSAKKGEYLPLFGLSRFPASSRDELKSMCDNAAGYMTLSSKSSGNTVLTTYNRNDYESCKESIYSSAGSTFPMVKCYDGKCTKQALIDEINKGKTFINYRGHGNYDCWQSSNGLNTSDVGKLKDSGCLPHVFSICCNNNDMRRSTCFGVEWLKKNKAITFLGASAPSYTVVNHDFDKYIWEALKTQKLTNISDIYMWATTTLYKNRKGDDLTKTNIQEYLLLGDPSANYQDIDKTVGYVLMLDASGTMYDAQNLVKINAKAFVQYSLPGDQFGVNMFSDKAKWICPQSTTPTTVSRDLHETRDAAKSIETTYSIPSYHPMTNISDAIKLGNAMHANLSTDVKAFILLSDGAHNAGGSTPDAVLGSEPPLYVAGMGPYFRESYYKSMLQKNPKSKLYYQPDAYGMMLMFNDIRNASTSCGLLINQGEEYEVGSSSLIRKFRLSQYDSQYQLGVVWTDKKYHYTDGYPGNNGINVILYDPNNQKQNVKPTISGDGYCIFDIDNAIPGEWTVLLQYSTNERMGGTVGGFEKHPVVQITSACAPYVDSLSSAAVRLTIRDQSGSPVTDAKVTAKISKAACCAESMLKKYADQIDALDTAGEAAGTEAETYQLLDALRAQRLQDTGEDIFKPVQTFAFLQANADGIYECALGGLDMINQCDSEESGKGIYTAECTIEGINPHTHYPYTYQKSLAILVE